MNKDIFEMAYRDDAEGIRNALASGVDPNEAHPRAGTLPVQLACQGNALRALKLLLEGGADANAFFTFDSRVTKKVVTGRTALMYVKTCDAAVMLLEAGADINQVDSMGWSPLVHAAHGALLDVVELLLTRGATITVSPWYDGRYMSLQQFLSNRCEFLELNADILKQPFSNDALIALRKVRTAIEHHSQI